MKIFSSSCIQNTKRLCSQELQRRDIFELNSLWKTSCLTPFSGRCLLEASGINQTVYILREKGTIRLLRWLFCYRSASLIEASHLVSSSELLRGDFIPRLEERSYNQTFMRAEARSHWAPLIGAICQVHTDEYSAAGLSHASLLSFLSDAVSRSPPQWDF